MRSKSFAVAMAALAGPSLGWAQPAPDSTLAGGPESRRGGLVFHVSGGAGRPVAASLGLVERSSAGAVLRQRRQMQSDCTWTEASDLAVDLDEVVLLQNPRRLGGAEQFGAYYATLFSALVTSKGAAATPTQQGCVRQTMTRIGEGLLRRQAAKGASSSRPILPEE